VAAAPIPKIMDDACAAPDMLARRLPNMASSDRFDSSDQRDWFDKAEPVLIDEPIENTDANEPTLPMEAKEPMLPIDSTDPREPIESTELVDHNDQRLSLLMSAIVAHRRPAGDVDRGRPSAGAGADVVWRITREERAAVNPT
jgi:hypothetical protein